MSDYVKKANEIYNNNIKNTIFSSDNNNLWRMSWAIDTLNDYFSDIAQDESASFFNKLNSSGVLNPAFGAWWDDYGWDGIASLRSAFLVQDETMKDNLIKNAINCWCYMYGPGWEEKGGDGSFQVPFPEVYGWGNFIGGKASNVGAPNVYQYWETTQTPAYYKDLQPLYTPGGLWNTTSYGSDTSPDKNPCGFIKELNGLQNTVTNALFTILSYRVLLVLFFILQEPNKYLQSIKIPNIAQVWFNQYNWFTNWFTQTSKVGADATLAYFINNSTDLLIRERVSLMANNHWSPGYCDSLAWLGDQGLMFQVLQDIQRAKTENKFGWEFKDSDEKLQPLHIINGVMQANWSNNGYSNQTTPILRPWVQYGASEPYGLFPAGDDADYQTGIAVFCRYLQQAMKTGFTPDSNVKKHFKDLADQICKGYFDTLNPIACDGLIPTNEYNANGMTAYINQLAVLCLANQM